MVHTFTIHINPHKSQHICLTNSYLGIHIFAYILERLISGIFITLGGERRVS
jgi:hypothetical protein